MARFTVKDNTTGKRYKSLNLAKASDKAGLDAGDAGWAIGEYGKADSDTHTVVQQSNRVNRTEKLDGYDFNPRRKSFAFRG